MSGITDSIGEGWDDRKIKKNQQKKQHCKWTRRGSHDHIKPFEHAYIILSTMTKIKLTTKKGEGNLFTIECYMPSFEPQNETAYKQHAVMFNYDKFTFHPQKDLVLSMPY
jgi:hypothetical protein